MNEIDNKEKSSLKTRIITAAVMVACIIPPFMLGGIPLRVLILVVTFFSAWEAASLADQKFHLVPTLLNFAAICAILFSTYEQMVLVLGVWIVVLFTIILVDEKKTTDEAVYSFMITVISGLGWASVLNFYDLDDYFAIMCFTALAAFGTDTGAYIFGMLFGKHKMIPRISPNKTWEGSICGYLTGLGLCLLIGLFFISNLPLSLILVSSFVLPVAAQIGDLSFSAIKRHFGLKDFGKLLPGHGGILDRVDSLVFVLMIFHGLLALWGV